MGQHAYAVLHNVSGQNRLLLLVWFGHHVQHHVERM
jgi:hypothetical protein